MRLRALWRREQMERDLDDEMAFHLAMRAEESGDSSTARRHFGNPTALKESCRELWVFTAVEIGWQDFRYALRTLARNQGVTWVAIAALALGTGANTTVFTAVSSALSFDMGVDHIERLVMITPSQSSGDNRFFQSLPAFRELASGIHSIDHLAAYTAAQVNVGDSRALPEPLLCVQTTVSGWDLISRRPILGRGLSRADELPGATPVVVLSHRTWQNRYGADASILGKAVRVDGKPKVIVGVMPAGVVFPEGADLWTTLTSADVLAGAHIPVIFGRLADGTNLKASGSEIDSIARRLNHANADGAGGPQVEVRPFLEIMGIYEGRKILVAVVIAVGFVLLIVCADVANLLLAQAARRGREISIRIAVGAGRARIVRQLLMESILLAIGGGVAGWMIAALGLHWFDVLTANTRRPAWIDFSMNARAFAYLAAISLGAGVIFGLAPALRLANTDINGAMKDGGSAAATGSRSHRLASLLVGFQMALCVVLLAGAGLLIRSSVKLYNAPLVVNASDVLTMRVSLPEAGYSHSEQQIAFFSRLKTKLQSLPGVESVSFASDLPMGRFMQLRGELEGQGVSDSSEAPTLNALIVAKDYFRVMQVGLRLGRSFSERASAPGEAIVNESFAARSWPGENALGKHLRMFHGTQAQPWLTVIGVVPDIPQDYTHPLDRDALVYLNYVDQPQRTIYVAARTGVSPPALRESFRRAVRELDENLPAEDVEPLEDHIARNRLNVTSFGLLFTIFAAIAIGVASVGLYGVVAQAVSRRTREIGIRMAIGARRIDIFRLVMIQGMGQVAIGVAAGLPPAFAVSRVLRGVLVGISPNDPFTFAAVILVLALAGLLGCAIPARRAVRVEPQGALRLG